MEFTFKTRKKNVCQWSKNFFPQFSNIVSKQVYRKFMCLQCLQFRMICYQRWLCSGNVFHAVS